MSRTRTARAVLAVPRAVVCFLGLTAVIVGILAMHVWMGGHGPAGAHAIHALSSPMPAVVEPAAHHAAPHADSHVSQAAHGAEPGHNCAGSCGDDAATLALCVLAFIVVTALAFLLPAGRLVPGSVLLRGPPLIRLRPLSIPVPSLIHLCISRT